MSDDNMKNVSHRKPYNKFIGMTVQYGNKRKKGKITGIFYDDVEYYAQVLWPNMFVTYEPLYTLWSYF